jgi:uncharacterized protein YjbI with pentapeptide repeats
MLLVLIIVAYGSEGNRQQVNASDILTKIEKGEPTIYNDIDIIGDLVINRPKLPITYANLHTWKEVVDRLAPEPKTFVRSPIIITNSTIEGDIGFNNTVFKNQIYFYGSVINGTSYFVGSRFMNNNNFAKTHFERDAYFQASQFDRYAIFDESIFNGTAYFGRAKFDNYTYFSGTKINDAYFYGAQFSNDTYFTNAVFGNAYFGTQNDRTTGANFGGFADFQCSRFNGMTYFDYAIFQKEVTFANSLFKGRTDFYGSQFKDDALFKHTDFSGIVNFTRTKYNKLYIRWASINNHGKLEYDDAAYLSLIQNFKALGLFGDADDCYYKYRETNFFEGDASNINLYRILDGAALILYGYGVEPLYTLICASALVLLFWLIYLKLDLEMNNREALKFSISVLLSGAQPFLFISSDLSRAGKHKNLALMEKIMGSMLFYLFMITLAKRLIIEIV